MISRPLDISRIVAIHDNCKFRVLISQMAKNIFLKISFFLKVNSKYTKGNKKEYVFSQLLAVR